MIASHFCGVFVPFRLCIGAPGKIATTQPALKFTGHSGRQPAGSVIQLGKTVDPASCVAPIHHTHTHTHSSPHPYRVALPDVRVCRVCAYLFSSLSPNSRRVNGNCGRLPRYLKTAHTTIHYPTH